MIIIWYKTSRKYDKDSKDLHAGICANPQKGAQ